MNTLNPPMDTQQLSQLVYQFQQQLFALQEQVQQHHHILEKMDKLEKENSELREKLLQLSHENENLRDSLATFPTLSETSPTAGIEPLTQKTSDSKWARMMAQPAPKSSPGRSLKKKDRRCSCFPNT